jgi:hypothetical protein
MDTARDMLGAMARIEPEEPASLVATMAATVHLMGLRGAGVLGGDLMNALSDLGIGLDAKGQTNADLLKRIETMCEQGTCPKCGAPRERVTGEDHGWYHLDPGTSLNVLRRCITPEDSCP